MRKYYITIFLLLIVSLIGFIIIGKIFTPEPISGDPLPDAQKVITTNAPSVESLHKPVNVIFSETIRVIVSPSDREVVIEELSNLQTEIEMLSKVIWREGGAESLLYQSAVAWTVLNQVDAPTWENTISGIITSPGHFCWIPDTPVYDTQRWLAEDIITRWLLEKMGYEDVGRTLPNDYYYFSGDGITNYFRQHFEWNSGHWDWSLPNPYEGIEK